jgi:hypothetical protein
MTEGSDSRFLCGVGSCYVEQKENTLGIMMLHYSYANLLDHGKIICSLVSSTVCADLDRSTGDT